jgi:hypothetical protein
MSGLILDRKWLRCACPESTWERRRKEEVSIFFIIFFVFLSFNMLCKYFFYILEVLDALM